MRRGSGARSARRARPSGRGRTAPHRSRPTRCRHPAGIRPWRRSRGCAPKPAPVVVDKVTLGGCRSRRKPRDAGRTPQTEWQPRERNRGKVLGRQIEAVLETNTMQSGDSAPRCWAGLTMLDIASPPALPTLATATATRIQRHAAASICAAFAAATARPHPDRGPAHGADAGLRADLPGRADRRSTRVTTYLFFAQYRRTRSVPLLVLGRRQPVHDARRRSCSS